MPAALTRRARAAAPPPVTTSGARRRPARRFRFSTGHLYVLPAFLVVGVVSLFPLLYTLWLSTRNHELISQNRDFAGWENYRAVLADPAVRSAAVNTTVYTVSTVLLSLLFGLLLAMLVNQIGWGRRIFRTAFFMPMLMAPAVVGVMWRFLFNDQVGLVTLIGDAVGYNGSWLGNPTMAMVAIIVVDVWQWTPFVFMLLLAGLEAAPGEPVEAARIDGANAWQIFRNVTLPAIMPLIVIALLFRFTWAFRGFDHVYTMTQGGPGGATELLSLAVWRRAFVNLDFGQSSAIAMLMFLLMTAIAIGLMRSTRTDRG
ncbi:sugar ABC transporter permease [Verrucosispora sp. WMMD573]|uniref:carbohydrate ABC transporter permease n=1 Tax=Verrucosispora sp. WMMD573 TaxID=3015149 RepID=UPI00248C05D5|nr:sugar ABC transporter permease [Verrucosispora sp. WMMD573]WBB54437.1 sugar ABC transporter permease [Verrucosispora sp. WMMD573]